MLRLTATHARLHTELQSRMAKIDPAGQEPYRAQELHGLVGADLMLQLKSTVEGLAQLLPELSAHGAEVTLRGEVRSWAERDQAQGTAWSAPGVANVVNELTVRT
jgi:hypothetical protein